MQATGCPLDQRLEHLAAPGRCKAQQERRGGEGFQKGLKLLLCTVAIGHDTGCIHTVASDS